MALPLRFLGPWSAAHSYPAGSVASDSGAAYLCLHPTPRGASAPSVDTANWTTFAPVPIPPDSTPTRIDSFVRDNQDGWGTASDGYLWSVQYAGGGTISIASNHGVLTDPLSPNQNDFAMLFLGPTLIGDDREMLVRWTYTGTTSNSAGPVFFLRRTLSSSMYVLLRLNLDGHLQLSVHSPAGNESAPGLFGADPTWAMASSGDTWWTRWRTLGNTYYVRWWPDGDPEPSDWGLTWTTLLPTTGGFVGLSGADRTGGATVAFDSFSVVSPPPDARIDLFDRADQDGWGTSTNGHVWTRIAATDALAPVVSGTGQLIGDPITGGTAHMMMADALDAEDLDYLVTWTSHAGGGPLLYFRASADAANGCYIQYNIGHWLQILVGDATHFEGSDAFTSVASTLTHDTAYKTRISAVGRLVQVKTWLASDPEPGSFDHQFTSSFTPNLKCVGLSAAWNTSGLTTFDDFYVNAV